MDQLCKLYGLLLTVAITVSYVTHCSCQRKLDEMRWSQSVYAFTVLDTFGQPVELKGYIGHVLLIVNIASHCRHTVCQYAGLAKLRVKYEAEGLRILNFPCNQFGKQMPVKDGEPMLEHLEKENAQLGDVFAKIKVKGPKAHPLYKWLAPRDPVEWNFVKFLIDYNGQVYKRYDAHMDPTQLAPEIELLLKERNNGIA